MALLALSRHPDFKVVGLLTSITRGYERVSIHGVRRAVLEAQVERLDLPLREISLAQCCSNKAYESAFHEALREKEAPGPTLPILRSATFFSSTSELIESACSRGLGLLRCSRYGAATPLTSRAFSHRRLLGSPCVRRYDAARCSLCRTSVRSAAVSRAAAFSRSLRRTRRVSHVRFGRTAVQRAGKLQRRRASAARTSLYVLRY